MTDTERAKLNSIYGKETKPVTAEPTESTMETAPELPAKATAFKAVKVDKDIFKVTSEGDGATVRYSTTVDDVELFNAVSGTSDPVKDYLDKEVEVCEIVITSADIHEDVNDDDSPIVSKPCVHFYTTDGKHLATLSNGIIKNTRDLIGVGFAPTKEHPITIRFKTVQTKKGIAHTFDLVKRG